MAMVMYYMSRLLKPSYTWAYDDIHAWHDICTLVVHAQAC